MDVAAPPEQNWPWPRSPKTWLHGGGGGLSLEISSQFTRFGAVLEGQEHQERAHSEAVAGLKTAGCPSGPNCSLSEGSSP